jgi:xylose isomerase
MSAKTYFPGISQSPFEGKASKNPLAFRYYEPNRVVYGKPMKDWFNFAMAWWHTLCADGNDPFGGPTIHQSWKGASDPIEAASQKWMQVSSSCKRWASNTIASHDIDLVSKVDSIETIPRPTSKHW